MADSPPDTPDTGTLDGGTPDSGVPDTDSAPRTDTAEILERVREDRLANAVEELMAEDEDPPAPEEARAEAWEGHEEALRAQYQEATKPTPEDLEQPPLIENAPPEGPLIQNPPPEGPLIEAQPAIHPKVAAIETVALEGLDALLANKSGVPEVASTLVRTAVNAVEARSSEGIRAQTATLLAFIAIDLAAAKANVPGTDPNAAELINSLKEHAQAEAENRLGEPPTDQDGTADR